MPRLKEHLQFEQTILKVKTKIHIKYHLEKNKHIHKKE